MLLLQTNVLGGNKWQCFQSNASVRGCYTNIDIDGGPK